MWPLLIALFLFHSILAEASPVFLLHPDDPTGMGEEIQKRYSWEKNGGRQGGPSLRISTASASEELRFPLFSKTRPLATPDRLRFETWLKPEGGDARIDLIILDENTDTEMARYALHVPNRPMHSPAQSISPGWEYLARDIPLEEEGRRLGFNIEVSVLHGTVRLDGLALVGTDSIITNGDFEDPEVFTSKALQVEPIPRGWRRSYFESNRGREAEGTFTIASSTDANGLLVQKTKGEFVLSAEPLRAPHWVTHWVYRGLMDGSTPLAPSLWVRQFGQKGLLKEDRSTHSYTLGDTNVISTERLAADPQADRVLCLLQFPEPAGEYRFQAAHLIPLSPPDPRPQIFWDQVGYDSEVPLRFLVASPFFPASGTMTCLLRGESGPPVQERLKPLGRVVGEKGCDWSNYVFEGLFTDVSPGRYTLEATLDDRSIKVDRILVDEQLHLLETGELAYRFFYYQRCGCEVPEWHGPCHLDDGKLPDGTPADVRGGYHNAGDYHKHMGDNTPVAVYAMASAYEQCQSFFDGIDRDRNERSDLLDEVYWGADWLLKMVDPVTGRFWMNVTNDIDYYGIPETDTDGVVGNGDDRAIDVRDPPDLGAYALGAWAILSRCGAEPKYLQAAERTWRVCESRILDSLEPRLLIAAIELYRTTHNDDYRRACEKIGRNLLALQDSEGWFAGSPGGEPVFRIVDEGTLPAALAMYILEWPENALAEEMKDALRRYYAFIFRMTDNPYGILRHYSGSEPFYFKKREDWFGGSNSAYCSLAWAASLASRVFAREQGLRNQLDNLASDQMHWVLGMNPLNLCMFEGKGNSERILFHHNYATIPGHPRGAVPGALPNGIVREPGNTDRPWFDLRSGGGSPPGAESAEPWLPHNAYYLLMLGCR